MSNDDFLLHQLCGLGEMLADGLGDEPDGKWIGREYRSVARRLGIVKSRQNNTQEINDFMAEHIKTLKCPFCGGGLRQSRSGSLRGICKLCSKKFVVGRRAKKR